MSTQPEALRLAEYLELGGDFPPTLGDIAVELRRLHAENERLRAENERLHQINCSHEVKLSVRGYTTAGAAYR